MNSNWIQACDVIVFNYLRQNSFGDVANDFKSLRKISTLKADSYKHLTLEKISLFVERKRSIGAVTRESDFKKTSCAPKEKLKPNEKSLENFLAKEKIVSEISAKVVRDYIKGDSAFTEVLVDLQTKLRIPHDSAPVSLAQLFQLEVPEKSYDDWSRISSGFYELVEQLQPENPNSEVDKVVKFILDENIPVRHINLQFADFTNVNAQYTTEMKFMRKKCPGNGIS